jgi:hypothetical protein
MVAAIAGWLYGVWPANPMTLGISALAVIGGPMLGIVHVVTAHEAVEPALAPRPSVRPAPAPAPRPAVRPAAAPAPRPEAHRDPARALPLTQGAAAARAFYKWRSEAHPAIARRERERRASQYIRR